MEKSEFERNFSIEFPDISDFGLSDDQQTYRDSRVQFAWWAWTKKSSLNKSHEESTCDYSCDCDFLDIDEDSNELEHEENYNTLVGRIEQIAYRANLGDATGLVLDFRNLCEDYKINFRSENFKLL